MKKLLNITFLLISLLFINLKAFATDVTGYIPHKIIVQFEQGFSTDNPPSDFVVITNDDYNITNSRTLEKGTKIYVHLRKVSKEKIGKQSASAEAVISKVWIPSTNKTINVAKINPNAIVKFSKYEKLDIADIAVDTGITVTNFFVKNITYPAHFAKGVIKNETGNRLESGVKETYDSSVVSYLSKGEAFIVKSGDLATLTFYTKNIKNDSSEDSKNTVE